MANIKNFGLVGVATDVQFGKAGPRLINDTNVFTFKNAAGSAAAPINAGVATVSGLTVGATGVVNMGANKVTNVAAGVAATDAVNFKQLTDSLALAGADTSALLVEINKIETAVGLDDNGDLVAFAAGSAFGSTSFKDAIERVAQAGADEVTARQAMGAQLTEDYMAADAALATQIQTAIAGISWKNPVKQMVADIAARDAVVDVASGDRIYVAADHKVYTFSGSAFNAGEVMTSGAAFFDKSTTVPYVYNGTTMVQFNGAAGLTGGLGLVLSGNNLDLDLAISGGLRFYPDGSNPNNTVGLKLDGASLEVGTAGLKVGQATLDLISAAADAVTTEATRAGLAEAAIQASLNLTQAELDATQVGAGLSTAGAYVAEAGANYIGEAESLKAADLMLDGAIKSVADAVAALGSGSITDLRAEVDFIEAAVGLGTDGKFVAFTDTSYLDSATSIVTSLTALDIALKAMDTAYKAADVILQGNIEAEETRALAAEAATLAAAKAYADSLDAIRLTYVNGQVTLLQSAIAEAIETAAEDATAKADQALVDAKQYVNDKIIAGVQNAARAMYVQYDATAGSEVSIGMVTGFVHRIKVYVTTAASTDSAVQVGRTDAPVELASGADIDSSTVGLYNLEVNQVYSTATELKVFMADGAKGTVVIEYLA